MIHDVPRFTPDFATLLSVLIGVGALAFGGVMLGRMLFQSELRVWRARRAFQRALAEEGRSVRVVSVDLAGEGRCALCRFPMASGTRMSCPSCSTPCHQECWTWNGGCAVYACAQRRIFR